MFDFFDFFKKNDCPCCGYPNCGHGHDMQAQGLFDVFKFTDKEVVDKIIELVKAIDVDKIKKLMDFINIDDNTICFEIKVKKE